MARESEQLRRLGELSGYRVVSDDPDPRGWDVVTRDGDRLGRIDELIVDLEAHRTRYLDVHLDAPGDHRHVLIPASTVQIGSAEKDRRQVAIGAGAEYLAGVTPYTGLPLTREQSAEYDACPPAGPAASGSGRAPGSKGDMRHG